MQHLCIGPLREAPFSAGPMHVKARFFCIELSHMLHRFCAGPRHLEF